MEKHTVKIKLIEQVTHDVVRIVTSKPEGYKFTPGRATEVAINKPGWKEEKRPFTFTNLPIDNHLEFTIKTYPLRKGVTHELLQLTPKDELIVHEVFGAIAYKGSGVFIAGGAGVTPFISIFRDLRAKNEIGSNKLVFANKAKADIILEKEFRSMLGIAFFNILSDEKVEGYYHGMISEDFLESTLKNFNQQFYVCGPPPFMEAVLKQLSNLGVGENAVTVEL